MWYGMAMTERQSRGGRVIHPRLPDDLHAELAEYATAHDRTVNNAVVYLLRRGLEAERGTPPDQLHTR